MNKQVEFFIELRKICDEIIEADENKDIEQFKAALNKFTEFLIQPKGE